MSLTDQERLRDLLGERIPVGGTDADTRLTDGQIEDFLAQGQGSLQAAAYWGWQVKMAEFANLANITEGNASREMGELHKAAKRMVDMYAGYVTAPSRGRVRLGKIRRREYGEED